MLIKKDLFMLDEVVYEDDLGSGDPLSELIEEAIIEEHYQEKVKSIFNDTVIIDGTRYYYEDLSTRDYNLENTTPYQIMIKGKTIKASTWGSLIPQVAKYLVNLHPQNRLIVYSFVCKWSKSEIFTDAERSNYKFVTFGLYIKTNFTAQQSCWLIQDLIKYFKVDYSEVELIIYRPSSVEPERVKKHLERRFVANFKELIVSKVSDVEMVEKVLSTFENVLNPLLSSFSKTTKSFYLFDNSTKLNQAIKKTKSLIDQNHTYSDETKEELFYFLDLLVLEYKRNKKRSG